MIKTRRHFWHTSCDDWRMAKKVDELKLAQESWGQSEVTNRNPTADSAALYLMQVRLPRFRVTPPRKRLPIFVDDEARIEDPCPVKIRHLV
jgi:hypothetical protein